MEIFCTLLALCAENSPVTGVFPSQRPVTRSFDVFFHLHPNKLLGKQSRRRWFETPSPSLCHHCNGVAVEDLWSVIWAYKIYQGLHDFGSSMDSVFLRVFFFDWKHVYWNHGLLVGSKGRMGLTKLNLKQLKHYSVCVKAWFHKD